MSEFSISVAHQTPLPYFASDIHPHIGSAIDFSAYNAQFVSTCEMMLILLFGANGQPIGFAVSNCGTSGTVQCSIRDLVHTALVFGSSSILMAHNHPSGDPTPSYADIIQTRNVVKALAPLKIALRDHIICTTQNAYSFKLHGLI